MTWPRVRKMVAVLLLFGLATASRADDATRLAAALAWAEAGDWSAAQDNARQAGGLAGDIVEWQRLRAGLGEPQDYTAFLVRRGDWPGLALLQQKGEAVFARSAAAAGVIGFFAVRAPSTGAGALALARAYRDTGDGPLAEAEAVRAWLELSLTEADQAGFLEDFGTALAAHHAGRLDAMLWQGRAPEARRMLGLVVPGLRAVGEARLGLAAKVDGVDAMIKAVPAAFADGAGLAHARFKWRLDKGRLDDAADLLVERSVSAEALGRPEVWADARALLARRDMREGQAGRAYALAAGHHLTDGSDYADLEWLAGYVALQKLGDPARALRHFQRLRVAVRSEISLGRAGYWEGRAHEALGDAEAARVAYEFGAEFQTGFYGLLAAEKAGLPMDPALTGSDTYPDWKTAAFMGSSVLQAGLQLQAAGRRDLAKRFVLHLAESLGPVELGQLADLALALNEPHIALMVAKQAAERGTILYRAYYPLAGPARLDLPVPVDLALAVSRRESEFDPAVVSSADARGLMQLLPGTAKLMAAKVGLPFEPGRLTTDPEYNARLGSAYLAGLRAEFGTSPLLVASGYNAGPGRPRRWISEFGDPRTPGVDPVDWIEHVPFTETRTYIMRVTESMLIYRARLAGAAVPIRLMEEMTGR